jgi:hypothetical protein
MNTIRCAKIFLTVLVAFLVGGSEAQTVSWSGSGQFTTGSYFFEETTKSFYFVNGLQYTNGRLSLGASVPLVVQNSPWISYTSRGALPTGGTQHGAVAKGAGNRKSGNTGMMSGMGKHGKIQLPDTTSYNQMGVGDPWANASFSLLQPWSRTSIRITAGVKVPVASPSKGFGTGAWDAGAGFSLSQQIQNFFLLGDVSYWNYGDMDELELKDVVSYGAGIGHKSPYTNWIVNGSFRGSTALIEDIDPPMSITLGAAYSYPDSRSIHVQLLFGLTESAPDFSAGFGWNLILF